MAKGTLTIRILGDTKDFEKKVTGLSSKMGSVGKSMTLGVTTPIVAGMGLAVKAGAEEQQQMELLANTLRNNIPNATDAMVAANEEWITSMQNATGIADGDMRDAMQHLLVSGMSLEEAQKNLAIAMDVSKTKGKDLATVAQGIGKAYAGNVGGLGKLGLATKNAAGETLSFDQVMANASQTMGGAAAAAADTAAGRAEIMRLKMADLTENIGAILIPILDKLVGWLTKIVDWFNNLSPGAKEFGVVILGIAAAAGPVMLVMKNLVGAFGMVGKAWGILSKLFMANPWVLLIAAVIALVALIIANWDKIKAFLQKTWDWIKKTAGAVWDWLKEIFAKGLEFVKNLFLNWTLVGIIIKNWDKIKEGVTKLWDWLKDTWQGIIDWFKEIPEKLGRGLRTLKDLLLAPFKTAFNAIARLWNNSIGRLSFKAPSWVPGIGGKGFSMPKLPILHSGGVVPGLPGQDVLALLEAGEEVIPAGAREAEGGITVNNNFYGNVLGTEEELAKSLREEFVKLQRRGGRLGFTG